MGVPRWLLFLVAAWVIVFGLFRIYIALRPRPCVPEGPNFMRRGLYARSPRSHILFGVVYLVLGAFLIATGFGWAPLIGLGSCTGKRDSLEHPDSHTGVPASDRAGGK